MFLSFKDSLTLFYISKRVRSRTIWRFFLKRRRFFCVFILLLLLVWLAGEIISYWLDNLIVEWSKDIFKISFLFLGSWLKSNWLNNLIVVRKKNFVHIILLLLESGLRYSRELDVIIYFLVLVVIIIFTFLPFESITTVV